jgi:hypothetical protein
MRIVKELLLVIVAVAVFAEDFPEEKDVLVLGKDNFDKALSSFPYTLVEFCKCISVLRKLFARALCLVTRVAETFSPLLTRCSLVRSL